MRDVPSDDNIEGIRRVICHADCDAFFASVHELRDPSLRGKPVIVGGAGPRSIVTTASYAARKYGVGSAMPVAKAVRLCPQAIVIAPDRDAYRDTSEQVWAIVAQSVPALEQVGIDEAYADLTALENPTTAMRGIVADVKAQTGIQLSVGIAPSKLLAKILSDADKPAGFMVMSRQQALDRFAQSPPAILSGLGPKTALRLQEFGVATLAQLRDLPEARLVDLFGEARGRWMYRAARLIGSATITPVRQRKSISAEHTFPVDIDDVQEMRDTVSAMALEVGEGAEQRGYQGRTVTLKVRTDDFSTFTRSRTLPEPVALPAGLEPIALELLAEHRPDRPVRLLGVRLSGFDIDTDEGFEQLELPF